MYVTATSEPAACWPCIRVRTAARRSCQSSEDIQHSACITHVTGMKNCLYWQCIYLHCFSQCVRYVVMHDETDNITINVQLTVSILLYINAIVGRWKFIHPANIFTSLQQSLEFVLGSNSACISWESWWTNAKNSRSLEWAAVNSVTLLQLIDHRLNGSSSPALMATCLSYGKLCDFLTFFCGTRLVVRPPSWSSRKMAQTTWIHV